MNFADQRVLKSAGATLSATFVDQDGAPAIPGGTVTVGVVRADGTVLRAPGTATTAGTGLGVYTVALTPTENSTLDRLTVTWSASTGERVVTHVDVVGGYMFTLADLLALDGMSNVSKDEQRNLRQAVEELVELRTGWLWTPRLVVDTYTAVGYTWPGPLYLSGLPFRVLKSVKVNGVTETLSDWSFGTWGELDLGRRYWWSSPTAPPTLEVIYEAGEDRAPASLTRAMLDAAAQSQRDRTSGASARALGMTNEFGNINYARATAENLFGNPAVDAVLAAWDRRIPSVA